MSCSGCRSAKRFSSVPLPASEAFLSREFSSFGHEEENKHSFQHQVP
jgi:hypothetical protein